MTRVHRRAALMTGSVAPGRGDHDVHAWPAPSAARPTAPRCRPARAPAPGPAPTCGWRRRSGTRPARRGAWRPARSSCRRRPAAPPGRSRPSKIFLASSTAANETETACRAISVSVRTRLATLKAWLKSGCRCGPDRLARLGQREGVLHLAEDLRLAEHHRVEAGGDAEGVAHGVARPGACRAATRPSVEVDAALPAQVAERQRPRLARRLGHAVHLHPVAGREHDHLAQHVARLQVAEQLAQLVLLDGQLLAQLHRRVAGG